jgi:hypothetical protein
MIATCLLVEVVSAHSAANWLRVQWILVTGAATITMTMIGLWVTFLEEGTEKMKEMSRVMERQGVATTIVAATAIKQQALVGPRVLQSCPTSA